MINVLIHGALGKMGKKVFTACENTDGVKALCGVDIVDNFSNPDFPIYDSFAKVTTKPDVIIDFSRPESLDNILAYSLNNNVPVVLCTTGLTADDIAKVEDASKKVAFFRSANMSLGVNVLIELVKKATEGLKGFDIEIIETHHNQKVDAPSGTALMLADAIKSVDDEKYYTYGREGIVGKRDKNEIGIHAVRGGTVVGEHDVRFFGVDEKITLYHQATDRNVFAVGAVKAAIYLVNKENGLYNMSDVLNNK